jgi:hypothetical protein
MGRCCNAVKMKDLYTIVKLNDSLFKIIEDISRYPQ